MSDQNTDLGRASAATHGESAVIEEALASAEVGDGGDVPGMNNVSICLPTLADDIQADAAIRVAQSPRAHTTSATAAAVPEPNPASNYSHPHIANVEQQDWVTGNSGEMFNNFLGIFPANTPVYPATGEPPGWPLNESLAEDLIKFARAEALFNVERTGILFERARRQLFIIRNNVIEQRERERPITDFPYGRDTHNRTEMDRLALDHITYIAHYGDPLPPNTEAEKNYRAAHVAVEEAEDWYYKVKQWKVPAVDSEIFRYLYSEQFVKLLRDYGEDELLQGLQAEMEATRQTAWRLAREVSSGEVPQTDGSSSPPPTIQSTTQSPAVPTSGLQPSSTFNPNAARFHPRPSGHTQAYPRPSTGMDEPATTQEPNESPSMDSSTPIPFRSSNQPTPHAPTQQQPHQSPTLTGHPNFYSQTSTTASPLQSSLLNSPLPDPRLNMRIGRNTYKNLDTSSATASITHSRPRPESNIRIQGPTSALIPDPTLRHPASSLADSRAACDARAQKIEVAARDYEAASNYRAGTTESEEVEEEEEEEEEEDDDDDQAGEPAANRQTGTSLRGSTLRIGIQHRQLRGDLAAEIRRNAAKAEARRRGVRLMPLRDEPVQTLARAAHADGQSRRAEAGRAGQDDRRSAEGGGGGQSSQSAPSGLRGGAGTPEELGFGAVSGERLVVRRAVYIGPYSVMLLNSGDKTIYKRSQGRDGSKSMLSGSSGWNVRGRFQDGF